MLRKFLVIGCGQKDSKTFDYQKNKMSHQKLHPSDQFDTMDIDSEIKPSFVADINDSSAIKSKFAESQYQLVILERFPADYFGDNTAKSIKHLIDKNGMVIFLPTGNRILSFDSLITTMLKVEFNKCCVSPGVNLILFLNCDSNDIALKTIRHFIDAVPYVANLFTPLTLMQYHQDILSKDKLALNIWDCASLQEAYLEEHRKLRAQPMAPQIKALLIKGPQDGEKEAKEKDLICLCKKEVCVCKRDKRFFSPKEQQEPVVKGAELPPGKSL